MRICLVCDEEQETNICQKCWYKKGKMVVTLTKKEYMEHKKDEKQ